MRITTWTPSLTLCLVAAASVAGAPPATAAGRQAAQFATCTALYTHHLHGVGSVRAEDDPGRGGRPVTTFYRSDALYAANLQLDGDHDGVACERR